MQKNAPCAEGGDTKQRTMARHAIIDNMFFSKIKNDEKNQKDHPIAATVATAEAALGCC
jgi:hypothetical protein